MKLKKTIPFTIAWKIKIYLQMKEAQSSYSENYKTLLKETKDLNKWKDSNAHWLEDLILLRWQYSPNWFTDSTQSPSDSQLYRNWQAYPKAHMEIQGTQNSQNSTKKEEQNCRIQLFHFKTYFKAIVIQRAWN